jgi:hypothetical protein
MLKNKIALVSFVLITLLNLTSLTCSHHTVTNENIRMAIIEDIKGDRTAIEPVSDGVWNKLVELHNSKQEMWIGGVVEEYININPDPNYR